MTFSEIFKENFLSNFSSPDLSMRAVVIKTAICCAFALYIFIAYRLVTRKTFYDKTMNISIAIISVIVCGIILAIQSSIVISLGMVGALSIVRFRTAIKNPMDLIFLFWSISVGIICGAGLSSIAVVISAAVTGGILIFHFLPVAKAPVLLVVNSGDPAERTGILEAVKKNTAFYTVKSQTMEKDRLDMIIEVHVKQNASLLEDVLACGAVTRASLVTHDGEVTF